jgi:hypothetical protein
MEGEEMEAIAARNKTGATEQKDAFELLSESSWTYGAANFWILIMFGPLVVAFIIAYIVHLIHVRNLASLSLNFSLQLLLQSFLCLQAFSLALLLRM